MKIVIICGEFHKDEANKMIHYAIDEAKIRKSASKMPFPVKIEIFSSFRCRSSQSAPVCILNSSNLFALSQVSLGKASRNVNK